jgi:hypothetical protein
MKGQTMFAGKTQPRNFRTASMGKSTALRIACGGGQSRHASRTTTGGGARRQRRLLRITANSPIKLRVFHGF